ncbi:hypothetical protein ACRRTK_007943 [Alexandromys fortis]
MLRAIVKQGSQTPKSPAQPLLQHLYLASQVGSDARIVPTTSASLLPVWPGAEPP